jgi:hypothetical protein
LAQVLAFRMLDSNEMAVVDIDEDYVPKSQPTVFHSGSLPHSLHQLEDPRLFVHRGELYLLAAGVNITGSLEDEWDVRQYLTRLERLPGTASKARRRPRGRATGAMSAEPAGYRLVQLRQVLMPENVPSALILPADIDIRRPFREKNWVPFIYEDNIHFIYSMNPPVVFRTVADRIDADVDGGIRTEAVSAGTNMTRWRYGVMRGGTPAIYDADIGGYVAFFHSHDTHQVNTSTGDQDVLFYFMGFCVFAARPPFSIQLISKAPLMGPGFYNESAPEAHFLRVIWPAGLIVQPSGDFVVSYGRDDIAMRAVHIGRRKLMRTLQAPLPHEWEGPPC